MRRSGQKAVNIPVNGPPSIVVQTMREEDGTLRYSIRADYPQFRTTLFGGALEKVNKAIAAIILPDIAGPKQNAADDAAWAAKNPSEASQFPVDQSSFLNTEYEIPYLTNDLVSVRIRVETYSAGAAHSVNTNKLLRFIVVGMVVLLVISAGAYFLLKRR